MNAVIVDIKGKQAAALDESGRVVRIPNANYEIGQTIELHEIRSAHTPTLLKRLSTGVAAAVLIGMIGTGTAYAMPYGTVTLEGDTSIEYTINCFDYVLDVKAMNGEGEALLAEIDKGQLRHRRIDTAVGVIVEQMEQQGLFEQENAEIHIEANTKNESHSDRLREELRPVVEHEPLQKEPASTDPPSSDHPDYSDKQRTKQPEAQILQPEAQILQPEDIPSQEGKPALPGPENETPVPAPEGPPSQDLSAPTTRDESDSFNIPMEGGFHDSEENFVPAEPVDSIRLEAINVRAFFPFSSPASFQIDAGLPLPVPPG